VGFMRKQSRDEKMTERVIVTNYRMNRRGLMSKAGKVFTVAMGTTVFGALGSNREAFADPAGGCNPPCGRICSGCSASAGCPSGMITCTSSHFEGRYGCCPWASGYWYDTYGGRRIICRDCVVAYCPCCCRSGCCVGFCACRKYA
jgi:hypothetical protein